MSGRFARAVDGLRFFLCAGVVGVLCVGAAVAQDQQGGQQQAQVAEQAPAANPVAQNIPISSGDLLDIVVFDTPELSARLRVDQQGNITLPLGGDVKVSGLKVAEAAKEIEDRLLEKQIMLKPTVMVTIVEYSTKGVTVMGEVHSPGMYTLLGPHSLYDALAVAGGPLSSEGSTITVTHADDSDHPLVVRVTTTNYDATLKATTVLPGDMVMVSRADMVYVVGDVGRSGAYYMPIGQKLTVLTLMSLSGGPSRSAKLSRAAVVRQLPNGSVQRVNFDLGKVMKSEQQDLVLRAGDIVVVPNSYLKSYVLPALPGVASTASITAADILAYR